MKKTDGRLSVRLFFTIGLTVIGLLAVWELLSVSSPGKSALFVSPRNLVQTAIDLWVRKHLLWNLATSVLRLMTGLIIAIITSVPAGILIGRSGAARKWILPFFKALSPVPPVAWTPIILVALGVGPISRIFLVYLGCFFPILFSTVQGVLSVEPKLIMSARVHGAGEYTVITRILFRSSLGSIFGGVRIGSSMGLVMLVVAELFGGRTGIGYLLMQAKEFLKMPQMILCMILLGLTGWAVHGIIDLAENCWESWRGGKTVG